jgi:hypothetical protein
MERSSIIRQNEPIAIKVDKIFTATGREKHQLIAAICTAKG